MQHRSPPRPPSDRCCCRPLTVIMSLDTARNSIEDYKDEHFSVVFVDEVHKVKNPKAQLTKALKQLGG
jgi:SNF2 family DNA or RNA helicase